MSKNKIYFSLVLREREEKKNPKYFAPKKPSNNNKKKPLKKPSLKSTFAPTKEEIDRRPIVFFDITIDGVPAGTVFFELFNETVPKTAENFRVLSTGTQWGQIFSIVLAIIFVFV